jgi:hypothetical protein
MPGLGLGRRAAGTAPRSLGLLGVSASVSASVSALQALALRGGRAAGDGESGRRKKKIRKMLKHAKSTGRGAQCVPQIRHF